VFVAPTGHRNERLVSDIGDYMNDKFGFSQGTDSTTQFARLVVPHCGRNEKDDAPVIQIEIEHTGKITLLVYGDILSKEPTHEIPLGGAKVSLKAKAVTNG
jgi:hypothetical protein